MNILIVEDDSLTADALQAYLEGAGHDASFVSNGHGALMHLEAPSVPLPELIVLDLSMPCMDGETLLENLYKNPKWRSIPVLVTTAVDLDRQVHLRQRWPLVNILAKPYQMDEFRAALAAVEKRET